MRAAILQPTYLPWIGYFALMDTVDVFVLLDDAPFARRSWQQRCRILTATGPLMLSVPVMKTFDGPPLICDAYIAHEMGLLEKHRRSIAANYARTPYFADFGPDILDLLGEGFDRLGEFSIALIDHLRDALDIDTQLIFASELDLDGEDDARIYAIAGAVGASELVLPPGAADDHFAQIDQVERARVQFDYTHPVYNQRRPGDFVPYLSVLDLIFNEGPRAQEIMRSGVRGFSALDQDATPPQRRISG